MEVRAIINIATCLLLHQAKAQFNSVFNILNIFDNRGTVEPLESEFQYEYDFVIVGAGSGGSVLANRLSENENWTVLLLEAGGEENFLSDVPLMASIQKGSARDWGYKFERQEVACLGFIDKRCPAPRGKVIGGTSVINFLVYTRGNRKDFDEWEKLGNKNWRYDKILKYFIKHEDCSECTDIDKNFHGTNGELKIEHPHYDSPLLKHYLKAGIELGYNITDPNGLNNIGFSKVQATMQNGRRCSAAKAFLRNNVRERSNLQIVDKARVIKLLIDENKRVYGVEVLKNKQHFVIRAKREVLLAAGTYNSPHLLMLSGIGPRKELEKLKIPVVQNLKVGYNMQDHMSTSTLVFLINQPITITDLNVQNPKYFIDYVVNGHGPYTIPGGALGIGFIQTKYAEKKDVPDIELVLGAGALNGDFFGAFRNLIDLPEDLYRKIYVPVQDIPGFSISPVLLQPRSRGRVLLKDKNPLHWPMLYANYFQDDHDLKVLVEGIKMAVNVIRSNSFRDLNATLHSIPLPMCSHHQFESDSYWKCYARHFGHSLGHPVGTCKMGPDTDPDAVVDDRLRVKGVKGLRVVDASIMPKIVAGHTNSVVMMIGEKASDMIKEDWPKL